MVLMTYLRFHLVERCMVHPNKTYVEGKESARFLSKEEAITTLARWNKMGECWQYALLDIAPCYDVRKWGINSAG